MSLRSATWWVWEASSVSGHTLTPLQCHVVGVGGLKVRADTHSPPLEAPRVVRHGDEVIERPGKSLNRWDE